MILKTYKYRLYPTNSQQELIEKHFDCTRFIYNLGLEKKIKAYQKDKKKLSCFDLTKEIPLLKKENEWLKEVNAQSLQMSLRNLDNAFGSFFRKHSKFPRFKSKKDNKRSFQIPQKLELKENRLFIPKFREGIKCVVDRKIEGTIKTSTLRKTPTNKYFISILVECDSEFPKKKKIKEKTTVGIDLGIKTFATLSTGEKIDNPKFLDKSLKKLKKQQRWLSRKKKGSHNRKNQIKKVAKIYEKISNQRSNFLHNLSYRLTHENQVDSIAIEDLNVGGMLKNHHLSKAISDASWSEFRRQLEFKSEWYGKNLLTIGRFQPSSKVCSCGVINNDLKLSDREWTCRGCGLTHDRDILAANNIKRFALIPNLINKIGKLNPELTSTESSQ
jgi:putative transposase